MARLLKALVNEDTLLRTHCCPWCFLGRANWETFVAGTKCFWTKSETFFVSWTQNLCPQQMLRARGQTGKHLYRQQCVRNNVSSFARAFRALRSECQLKTWRLKNFCLRKTWSGKSRDYREAMYQSCVFKFLQRSVDAALKQEQFEPVLDVHRIRPNTYNTSESRRF